MNQRASTLPIEVFYTSADNHCPEFDPHVGYELDYPVRWLNDPSMNKCIGVRRLDATATHHTFALKFDADDVIIDQENLIVTVRNETTLLDVMGYLCDNVKYVSSTGETEYEYHFAYTYNDDGTLSMYLQDSSGDNIKFSITYPDKDSNGNKNIQEFLKFLNQEVTEENYNMLKNESEVKTFKNVWNRETIAFHASFSNSKYGFIGLNKDFYQKISLLYNAPSTNGSFNVWFTSDGKNPILPRYAFIVIQLSFIVNMNKSLVL